MFFYTKKHSRQIKIKTILFLYNMKNLSSSTHWPMTDINKRCYPNITMKRGQVLNQKKNLIGNQKEKEAAYLRMCLRICSPPPLRNSHNSREGPVKKNMNTCDILHLLKALLYIISEVLINKIYHRIRYNPTFNTVTQRLVASVKYFAFPLC